LAPFGTTYNPNNPPTTEALQCNYVVYTRKAGLSNGEGHLNPAQTLENEGDPVVYCQNVIRVSSTRLECLYPESEGRTDGCDIGRKIYVQAAARTYLEADAPNLCFDEPKLLGLPTSFTVSEGGLKEYKLKLRHVPKIGQLTIKLETDQPNCLVEPAEMILKAGADATKLSFVVQALLVRDESTPKGQKGSLLYQCKVKHTMASTDPDLAYYLEWSGNVESLEVNVQAEGCGNGEFLGLEYVRPTLQAPSSNSRVTGCVCNLLYYLPSPNGTSDCTICPRSKSTCSSIGMTSINVNPGFWREEGNLSEHIFYKCPIEEACLGGNSTIGRCADGHDDFGPVCATCLPGYILSGRNCTFCPSYDRTVFVNPGLVGLIIAIILVFFGYVIYFVTKSALTKEVREQVDAVLMDEDAHLNLLNVIEKHPEKSLTLKDFMTFMSTLDEEPLFLTRPEASLLFAEIDTGTPLENEQNTQKQQVTPEAGQTNRVTAVKRGSINAIQDAKAAYMGGQRAIVQADHTDLEAAVTSGGIEVNELKAYVILLLEKYNRPVNRIMDMYTQYEDKKAEAEEKTGQDADTEAIEEQQEGIAAAHEQMQTLPRFILPAIDLATFPNLLDRLNTTVDTPVVEMPELPSIDLQALSALVDFRSFLNELAKDNGVDVLSKLSECKIPALPFSAIMQLDGFEEWKIPAGMDSSLPEFSLGSFPGFEIPEIIKLPKGLGQFAPKLSLINVEVSKINMPIMKIPKVNLKGIKLKNMGGILMKVKLMLGFTQCMAMIPTTFSGITWPVSFNGISQFLNIASIDVMGLFGDLCAFHTGFLPKFLTQMILIPIIFGVLGLVYVCTECLGPKLCMKRFRFTTSESRSAAMFNVAFLAVYTFYTNISTSIFQLFKCHPIEGTSYLVADYNVKCGEGEWLTYMGIAVAGIFLYTIGIPLYLFVKLYQSREVLHSDDLEPERHAEHAMAQKKLGSVYGDYSNEAYYFDLIDLFRRILLTGALVLVGEGGGAQIFLGSVICLVWLTLIIVKRPYGAFWDNAMSAVLSFQLLLVTLIGMALTINQKTPEDEKDPMENQLFEIVLTGASILIIITAFCVIIMSIPCLATRIYNEDAEEPAEEPAEVEEEVVPEEIKQKKIAAQEEGEKKNVDDYDYGVELTKVSTK